MAKKTSFTERTEKFWGWFTENEEKLSEFVQNRTSNDADSNRMVKFITKGLKLISKKNPL